MSVPGICDVKPNGDVVKRERGGERVIGFVEFTRRHLWWAFHTGTEMWTDTFDDVGQAVEALVEIDQKENV